MTASGLTRYGIILRELMESYGNKERVHECAKAIDDTWDEMINEDPDYHGPVQARLMNRIWMWFDGGGVADATATKIMTALKDGELV